jgi:hypothetical protein
MSVPAAYGDRHSHFMPEALSSSKPRRFYLAVARPHRDQSLGGKTAFQLIQGGV